jgi:hypothetical protein
MNKNPPRFFAAPSLLIGQRDDAQGHRSTRHVNNKKLHFIRPPNAKLSVPYDTVNAKFKKNKQKQVVLYRSATYGLLGERGGPGAK